MKSMQKNDWKRELFQLLKGNISQNIENIGINLKKHPNRVFLKNELAVKVTMNC